jgi:leucyl aminopeptidase
LVNLPANFLYPTSYADLLKSFFKGEKVTVFNKQKLQQEGYGLISAVGQGSATGPYIVHLKIRRGLKKQKPIAVVGKGITFDTGGVDLKPSAYMRWMKKDMGGSATVAGVAHYLVKTKAKVNCDFYFAIAENSIARDSFRPGDIVESKKGLTVEVHNTDAEGRLALADAITMAVSQKEKPKALIDVATLTGAIKAGLGGYLPGMFCNDNKLQASLLKVAKKSGEPVWPMPLDPSLESLLNSSFADMVNASDGFGGAITAALFLEKFIEDLPWAHFDIYSWVDGAKGALQSKGGSGQMVQTLIQYLGELK